jgi:hypothetical protein
VQILRNEVGHRVRSPSRRRETLLVARALLHVVFWAAAVILASRAARSAGGFRDRLALDEIAFRALAPDDQREARAVFGGAGEAEDVRARSGGWPTVEALAARGVQPFAADPLDHAGYHWKRLAEGTVVNYVGTPDPASQRPTLIIVAVEPDPGTAPDPSAPTDETHHRLRDGTMLHVMVWTSPHARVDTPIAAPRLEDGWHRITLAAGTR